MSRRKVPLGLMLGVLALIGAVGLLPYALASAAVQGEGGEVAALQEASPPAGAALEETSCVACHGDADLFEAEEVQLVADFAGDVHAGVGLSCHDCHGGNPDPALFEDYVAAKDENHDVTPYRGKPDRVDEPAFCGSCHSDANYMRRFDPGERVDQEMEYRTSQHGLALAEGDEDVATCTSCHGVHGIRRPSDPGSRVYPTRVAATCSECHADATLMSTHSLPDGRPMPVDQFARWRESVHAASMFDREDLSAPTCNDCHGNHGASPPGLDSINFVCGQCHGREAEIFRRSPKPAAFELHNEYLLEAEGESCAACHTEPEPQATLTSVHSFGECAVCHGNHGVMRPSVAMLSPLPDTPCVFCHEGARSIVQEEHDAPDAVSHYEAQRDHLLRAAAGLGLEREKRFDWLVDQAEVLEQHTMTGTRDGAAAVVRRPEFARLFDKFRIGRTSYDFPDPESGEPRRASIIRCESCHASEAVLGEDAVGLRVAGEMLDRMRLLTTHTAEAERILLAARRGGVETRDALIEIDEAVDSRIGLDVLVHGFAVEGDFEELHAKGVVHAEAALVAGQQALQELQSRRVGLALSLIVIAFVLLGLGLKIRELSVSEGESSNQTT